MLKSFLLVCLLVCCFIGLVLYSSHRFSAKIGMRSLIRMNIHCRHNRTRVLTVVLGVVVFVCISVLMRLFVLCVSVASIFLIGA